MIPYLWEKPFTQSSCKSDDHFRGAPQKPGRKHCRRPRWVKTLIYQAYTQLVLVQVCRAWAQFIPSLKYLIKICCRKMEKEYPILNSGLGFFFTGKVIRWCCSCRNEILSDLIFHKNMMQPMKCFLQQFFDKCYDKCCKDAQFILVLLLNFCYTEYKFFFFCKNVKHKCLPRYNCEMSIEAFKDAPSV